MNQAYFSDGTIDFLYQLAANNNRDWFNENKPLYESQIREPALQLIRDAQDPLAAISTEFVANPKKMGGSLMRVYWDTRFSRDKMPYKTNIGIQFRHRLGKACPCSWLLSASRFGRVFYWSRNLATGFHHFEWYSCGYR
ncbi:MAG: TIGR02453 family protein [Motiliproteus sp.]|nr:TIGR02453 family protein [Motiliproteus sp.]MCW9052932.1 TIGR02453 family protein [Motiliproteus sp.]